MHHGFLADNGTKLLRVVDVVGVRDETSLSRIAVSAVGHSGAGATIVKTATTVNGAGLVGDLMGVHPLVGKDCVTAVAAKGVVLTVNQDLGRDVDVWPRSVSRNLYPVTEGRGGSMGPT